MIIDDREEEKNNYFKIVFSPCSFVTLLQLFCATCIDKYVTVILLTTNCN